MTIIFKIKRLCPTGKSRPPLFKGAGGMNFKWAGGVKGIPWQTPDGDGDIRRAFALSIQSYSNFFFFPINKTEQNTL